MPKTTKSASRSAADYLPPRKTLPALRRAAADCKGCDLYKRATQTVFGEGKAGCAIMMVGEQPGDQEDLAGEPFVGPAGRLLDQVLAELEVDRQQVYVTNAVKHFKWEPRGKRRLHSKPNSREISACRPWLEAELQVVKPRLVVCLGATAAQAVFGPAFRVTKQRGQILPSPFAANAMATYHPSALLRAPAETRQQMRAEFTEDLQTALDWLRKHK
jgi:DNA polymerase